MGNIEVCEILNGYGNFDSNICSQHYPALMTRGHAFGLANEYSRLGVRKFLFFQKTINVWNK